MAVVQVPEELRQIARQILAENKSADQWADIESDDMFQSTSLVGGYEAVEGAFCFSYYDGRGKEYWFQLTLAEMTEIATGERREVATRPAD